ncbi:DNA-binding transcriptional LysR family regulator [Modestobacter versicolor]|uniref:DNA-binding transcriptional LysR family regulator n=2 Tax=Modestobacter versicolor TaxID=429133 RepID=A0A839XUN6_9ACTN|nr:DNA-binding transcriptional LysR family regulator [Modestobacter versicolor]
MPLDLTTQSLRSLKAVAEAGSFTVAAERLGYTQSAVSKQVRALETATGATLFTRTARGVQPTAAGRALLQRATAILDQLDAAQHDVDALAGRPAGRVTLGGFPATAVQLVPQALAQLAVDHPDVEVEFRALSTPAQIRQLRSGRIELGVIAVGEALPDYDLTGLETAVLPGGPMLVAVSAEHRWAGLARVSLDELRTERWIEGRGEAGEPQFGVWPSLGAADVVHTARDWSTRLGLVAAGLGVTTVPSLLAAGLPRTVAVVRVDDPSLPARRLTLAWAGRPSPAAAAVRAAVGAAAESIARTWSGAR